MKKIGVVFIVLLFLFITSISQATSTLQDSNPIEIEDYLLEIASDEGFTLELISDYIKSDELVPYEFRGVVNFNNTDVTFGFFNQEQYTGQEFLDQIDKEIKDFYPYYINLSDDSKDDPKEIDITEEQISNIKSTLKVKIVAFKGKKEKIEQEKDYTKFKDTFKIKVINLTERNKWLKNNQNKKIDINSNDSENIDDLSKNKSSKDIKIASHSPSSNVKGGPSYNVGHCVTSAEAPRCGDGQDRLKQQQRFNGSDSVYNWLPNHVSSSTSQVNNSTFERKIVASFYWDSANRGNLVIDSNESVEAEVRFYNYGVGTGIPGDGRAYIYDSPPKSWSTNLPNGYLDTRYGDNQYEPSYAIGTATPNLIVAGNTYSFIMNAYPEGYTDTGLWQINFQRGYWLDSTNLAFRAIRGSGPEWYVFSEEYETTAKIKQYHKYNSSFYAPSSFNQSTATTYATQFRYKNAFTQISKGSTIQTGNVPSQGYQVYRLTVDTSGTFTISTSQYSTSTDTYLSLYDHNFNEISYNDDYNGLYSKISRYLDKGDYYIVVRGYNWNSMSNSYLSVN